MDRRRQIVRTIGGRESRDIERRTKLTQQASAEATMIMANRQWSNLIVFRA
jgi:hypothetical protein